MEITSVFPFSLLILFILNFFNNYPTLRDFSSYALGNFFYLFEVLDKFCW